MVNAYWSLWGKLKFYGEGHLPIRNNLVRYFENKIEVNGKVKEIKNDFHAVKFLTKIDTEDEYFLELILGNKS